MPWEYNRSLITWLNENKGPIWIFCLGPPELWASPFSGCRTGRGVHSHTPDTAEPGVCLSSAQTSQHKPILPGTPNQQGDKWEKGRGKSIILCIFIYLFIHLLTPPVELEGNCFHSTQFSLSLLAVSRIAVKVMISSAWKFADRLVIGHRKTDSLFMLISQSGVWQWAWIHIKGIAFCQHQHRQLGWKICHSPYT